MENSPNHQGGSDPPLYDPPPSYDEVIKLYLPPPPPYSAINRGRIRNNRNHAIGVDNRGYRNDNSNGVHVHTRRGRGVHQPRMGVQDITQPMVLKVSLPEEAEPAVCPSTRQGTYDRCCEDANALQEEASTSPKQNDILSNFNNDTNTCQQSNVICQSNSSPMNERVDSESAQSCECQGACSCKLIKRKVARCSSESKATIASSSSNRLAPGKAGITKKRSFKDMMQKSISRASSSAIIPHPASMTITVRPPRSKKTGQKGDSKSAGPSSPTSKDSPGFDSNEPLPSYRHCRSASGPSDLSASVDYINHLPTASAEVSPSPKSLSDNQILDASNLSQVKHLASVLFDGLQQSFNLKNEDTTQCSQPMPNEDETAKAPITWTNLLMPSRKRMSESGESSTVKPTRSWNVCDTLPLLSSGSESPVIVKFEDINTAFTKLSDKNKKAEILRSNSTD